MITGDKQETAINIAIACKLVHHIKDLLIVNAHQSEEAAKARLQDLLALCKASNPGGGRGTVSVKVSLHHCLVHHCHSQPSRLQILHPPAEFPRRSSNCPNCHPLSTYEGRSQSPAGRIQAETQSLPDGLYKHAGLEK